MLEFVEVAFDQIALAVDAPADAALNEPAPRRGNVRLGAAGPDQLEQRIRVIAAIGDDMAASQADEQVRGSSEIVGLSRRQHDPHRQAVFINDGVDLRAQSATRATDGVILAPFFPPAACWWARMMELSINAIEPGDLAASASNTLTQTPSRAQRLKRL